MFAPELSALPAALAHLSPDLPHAAWPLALFVLLILGSTAAYDARTGRVPDPPLFSGLLLTVAVYGFATDWPVAAHRLMLGLGALIVLWGVNHVFYSVTKRDSFGMGDAKWTMLAVTAFGIYPALAAWVVGAWLGLGWMGLRWLCRRKTQMIHFAPFLFAGLLVGLWWFDLR